MHQLILRELVDILGTGVKPELSSVDFYTTKQLLG